MVAVVLVLALALAAAAGGAITLAARHRYDAAAERLDTLISRAADLESQRATQVATASTTRTSAAAIAGVDATGLVDATAAAGLAKHLPALQASAASLLVPLDVPARPTGAGSWWPGIVEAASRKIEAQADVLSTGLAAEERQIATLTTANAAVESDQKALLASVSTVSAQVDAANDVATNDSRFAFRDAAAAVASADDPAAAFTRYVAAGHDLIASQAAEQAELAGPLRSTKLAIEQFARSIDGGVMLDFTWSRTLTFDGSTWGTGGSTAGWTQFWYGRGGYATISLTTSVAEQWPASKSLVVHEVGHAISTKCENMAPHDTRAEIEAWATAWAIGMGYTDPGNGTQAYGPPPASLVQVTKACR